MSKKYFIIIILLLAGAAMNAQNPNGQSTRLYFIGDAGQSDSGLPSRALQELQKKLTVASRQDVVVFLGDNIYPSGLPDSTHKGRIKAEQQMDAQLGILKDFKGNVYFIPGNHDWNKGKKSNGYQYVINQQRYVEKKLLRDSVFLPSGACPGPVAIKLQDRLLLILIDTQWLLRPQLDPDDSICNNKTESDFINELKDIVENHYDWQIIVAGHHPLYSEGNHGGYYTFRDHVFPLTNVAKPLYIPLPVIGSIYPLYRKYSGDIQDLANERYRAMWQSLLTVFNLSPNLVYVSGHEHTLQYFQKANQHYIVSGSGSKKSHVKKNGDASFSSSALGFAQLEYTGPDELNLNFVAIDDNETAREVYHIDLKKSKISNAFPISDSVNLVHQVKTSAGAKFKNSGFHNLWLGNHYREEWATPVTVEILDMDTTAMGLTPYKRGGGFQTKSLRLRGGNGKEYVLRSVQKDIGASLPVEFRDTFISDLMNDQLTSAHPYAALAIPRLAEAAGLLHTNPRLVFVPNSPRLKNFVHDFGNTLCLFEERPNGKGWAHDDQFEDADEIVSSSDLFKKVKNDNKHSVDQVSFARARLFDILINDWDRHEDQWIWAAYKQKGRTLYKPIPRDRDQPFACFDGVIPYAATRKAGVRKLHSFQDEISDLPGLTLQGSRLDRDFSNELDASTWNAIALELKQAITDEVIDEIINDFPDEVNHASSEEIVRKLKLRRNALTHYANEHYRFISKEIEVFGSNKHERFEVVRKDESTVVTVFQITKEGELKDTLYHRVIENDVTQELRLYGLAGKDQFFLTGKANQGIRIRIIGGDDSDVIRDDSHVKGVGKKTLVYDTPDNEVVLGDETKSRISDDLKVNYYERQRTLTYDRLAPKITPGYNPDDGVFIGGGFTFQKQQWRKSPYGYQVSLWGNYAIATGASNILFNMKFTDAFKGWDFILDGAFNMPLYVMNYYGLGNETQRSSDREYNRVRAKDIKWQPALSKKINEKNELTFNLLYQWVDVEATEGRFVTDPASELPATVFEKNHFAGAGIKYQYKIVDSDVYTRFGFHFNSTTRFFQNLDYGNRKFINLDNNLSLHIPIGRLVIAHRTGYSTNIGNAYEFYQANTLGSESNLRGFRRTRYSGKSALYQNTELRLRVATIHSYVFRGSFGVLGLFDNGRVWMPEEKSSKMHVGYGGGFFLVPYDKIGFTFIYSSSDDDNIFQVRLGFLF